MHAAFVTGHTVLRPVPGVPEILVRTAEALVPLWEAMEAAEESAPAPPPFWAFPWAGGQALARHVLDQPGLVSGRRVLDLASGSGVVAIAAALAGARHVVANDIDPYACAAIALNAAANGVRVEPQLGDLLTGDAQAGGTGADVILAGDVFYSRDMATAMLAFLHGAAVSGATVIVGDPSRTYAPQDAEVLATYPDLPVIRDLESIDAKTIRILHIAA